jgi:hypothetical protein
MLLTSMPLRLSGGTLLAALMVSACLQADAQAAMALEVPGQMTVCEGPDNAKCGTWTFDGADGTGQWPSGEIADLTVQQFDPEWVIIRRSDPAGVSAGLTAIYVGKMRGDRIEGTVTWQWLGHWTEEVKGTWSATLGAADGGGPASATAPAPPRPPGAGASSPARRRAAPPDAPPNAPRAPNSAAEPTPPSPASDPERDRAQQLALRARAQAPRGPREETNVRLPPSHGDPVVVACPNGPASGSGIDGRSAWRKGKSAEIIEGDGPLGTNWGHILEALDWYCKASGAGNPIAAYDIGQIYRAGFVVNAAGKSTTFTADPATAFYWYRLSADRGFTKAMLRLAQFYVFGEVLDLKGSGVAKDPKQALFWVKSAADKGDSDARLILASAYLGVNIGWGPALGLVPNAAKGAAFGGGWLAALAKGGTACADPDNRRSMIQLLPPEAADRPVRGISVVSVHGSMAVDCVVRLGGPAIRDDDPTLVQLMSLMHGGLVSSWRYYLTRAPGSSDTDIQRQTTTEAMIEGVESIAPVAKAVADAIDKHNKNVK